MRQAPPTLLLGQAGVWRVAAMLALKGLNPQFPGIDNGCDLTVEGLVRLQVKATRLRPHPSYDQPIYMLHLRRPAFARGNNTLVKSSTRCFSDDCDFVVLWGVDEDRFWIIPAKELDHVSFICVGPEVKKYDLDTNMITQLYKEGNTQEQIAAFFGVPRVTITRRLNGQIAGKRFTYSECVRRSEDKWDRIESLLSNRLQILQTSNAISDIESLDVAKETKELI